MHVIKPAVLFLFYYTASSYAALYTRYKVELVSSSVESIVSNMNSIIKQAWKSELP